MTEAKILDKRTELEESKWDSLEKDDVTIRDRDTEEQRRIKISELKDTLRKLISGEIKFENI